MSEVLDAELQRQILAAFAAETEERLQAITNHLLALEKQPPADEGIRLLKDIFREAHTLKGGARVLSLGGIEQVTHRLESLFGLLQSGKLQPHQRIFDLVYQALDAIGVLIREATTGTTTQTDVTELCARIVEAQTAAAPGKVAEPPKEPAPAPLEPAPASPPASAAVPIATPVTLAPPETPAAPVKEPAVESREAPRTIEESVRVSIAKLDALMADVGELQVARIGADQRLPDVRSLVDLCEGWEARWRRFRSASRRRVPVAAARASKASSPAVAVGSGSLEAFLDLNAGNLRTVLAELTELREKLESDSRRMTQILADLQDAVRRVRMLPIATVFDPFPRMVRDLARNLAKEVTLIVEGGENEMDRSLLEQIKGPLIHLLRNAVDHGFEAPAARLAAGKPAAGTLSLSASQRGGSIVIEVVDDGAGIDVERVKKSAVNKGWLTGDAAAAMSEREALWLIFRSGLSTKSAVTDVSGRGVGLDVVHEQVSRLGGIIEIDSRLGQGTRFSLRLPLTVATTLCLLTQADNQTFALPITNVLRIAQVRSGDIRTASGQPVIVVDGRPIPLARLADALDLRTPAPHAGLTMTAVILGVAEKRVAFVVDDVHSAQEVVIKKLPPPLVAVPLIAGVSILGTGEVVLVPHIAALLRSTAARGPGLVTPDAAPRGPAMILVADDSITTRMLEKNILEAAGYRVRLAADGLEAWALLQEGDFDLLLTDAEMPRLDGFGLTQKVRGDDRLKELPVVLMTSLDSAEDKQRGIRAGADAYVVKGTFDQEKLLAVVGQLI
jgi:two-component system chemotaxis sensor kinase CheA